MYLSELDKKQILESLIRAAYRAGDEIMKIYGGSIDARVKPDLSPVTLADQLAQDSIVNQLTTEFSDYKIVSEELKTQPNVIGEEFFWLVDPLDGTKEFINKNGEFTVNIALIQKEKPILGVVFAPAIETLYAGAINYGSFVLKKNEGKKEIECRSEAVIPEILVSRSHGVVDALPDPLSDQFGDYVARPCGSSLKFCLIAEGQADIYPRFGRTMEWDTAAGHAILIAAGGSVKTLDDEDLCYGKGNFENPFFIARGKGK